MPRRQFSERVDLINKAKEAALSAVQIYNNPLITFKTESYIVLMMIAWTYLLHAYYRSKGIEYRHFELKNGRRFFKLRDGNTRYWSLSECISNQSCPLDKVSIKNLEFLIGLRDQIVHKKATGLDSYLSARYQACVLNFNFYIKKLHSEKYGLDTNLALSLQFTALEKLDQNSQSEKEVDIPQNILSYIADFDSKLTNSEVENERFAYRLLFTKVLAKRKGQADRVVEFIDPDSQSAKNLAKEYWVKVETEKPKYLPSQIVQIVKEKGFSNFGMHQHTKLWQAEKAKDKGKGFGVLIAKTWYWYQNWLDFVIKKLTEKKEEFAAKGKIR